MCNCNHGCPATPVERRWVGRTDIPLRRRTGYNNNRWGVHENAASTWTLHRPFVRSVDQFIKYLDDSLIQFRGPRSGIAWVGCAGATTCKPGYHAIGRAIDLTRITLKSGKRIDMNVSWRADRPIGDRRLYLAVVAAARMHSSHVLGAYWRNRSGDWNTSHDNHIHVDNARGHVTRNGPEPLHRGSETDTVLVQLACNWLNGANLAVDGQFGRRTQYAYDKLRNPGNLKLRCTKPFHDYWDMVLFLHLICMTCCANKPAGIYKGDC